MRYSTRDVLNTIPLLLLTAFLITFVVGLTSGMPNLSAFAVWAMVALSLYMSIYLNPKMEGFVDPDRRLSFMEAIQSRRFWRMFLKKYAWLFIVMMWGMSNFIDWGLTVTAAIGLYLFAFHRQIEDCRMRLERLDIPND